MKPLCGRSCHGFRVWRAVREFSIQHLLRSAEHIRVSTCSVQQPRSLYLQPSAFTLLSDQNVWPHGGVHHENHTFLRKKTWQCTDICHLAFTLLILFMFLKATVVKHSNLYTDYHYSLLGSSICPFFFFWNTFTADVTLVFDNKQRGGDLG